MARWRRRLATTAAVPLALLVFAGPALPKPRVPPGRDPGGVAVVVIGEGLDYTRPEIARRLARDGEGEAIAWDTADNDARPHAPPGGAATALARIVLAEGQATRLVPVRMLPGPPTGIVAALHFAARTKSGLLSLTPPPLAGPIPQDRLAALAARLPQALLVIGTRHLAPEKAERPNVLSVAAGPAGDRWPEPGAGAKADVGVPLPARDAGLIEAALKAGATAEDVAVARVVALAARIRTVEPGLDGAGLKARILSHARLAGVDAGDAPTYGAILDVGRLHWLE